MKIVINSSSLKEAREIAERRFKRFYYQTSRKVSEGKYEIVMKHRKRMDEFKRLKGKVLPAEDFLRVQKKIWENRKRRKGLMEVE